MVFFMEFFFHNSHTIIFVPAFIVLTSDVLKFVVSVLKTIFNFPAYPGIYVKECLARLSYEISKLVSYGIYKWSKFVSTPSPSFLNIMSTFAGLFVDNEENTTRKSK